MSRLSRLSHPKWLEERDYAAEEKALQQRLARLQVAYLEQGLSAIVMVEGWDASGKGGLIRRLTAELDPRFFEVFPIQAPSAHEAKRHFLYRFWTRVPGRGEMSIFDRSWYGRVTVERIEEFCAAHEWKRAYAEINAFEEAQITHGTRLVKLFLHVSQEEQDKRLLERLEDPWKRWKTGLEDYRNRSKREAYEDAYEEMFRKTDTEAAPWHLIGADSKKHARIAGLTIVVETLENGVDLSPPALDKNLERVAEKALGVKI